MPATRHDSFRYQCTVAIRVGRVFPFVARLIAEAAGSDNVAFLILAAILSGHEVFRCALKAAGLGCGYPVLRGKCQRIRRPHGELAVVAKAMLAAKGRETELGQSRHKRFHIKTMKPARPYGIPSGNQPALHRAGKTLRRYAKQWLIFIPALSGNQHGQMAGLSQGLH